MLDTILVGAIIMAALIYVGRRLYRQFTTPGAGCNCSGCGQANSCSSAHTGSNCSDITDLR